MANSPPQVSASAARAAEAARAPRTSRLIVGCVRRANGALVGARIRNLSALGLGGKADAELARGEPVEVMLPGLGSVTGRVAWSHHDKFGLTLDASIDPAIVTFQQPSAANDPYVVPTRHRPVLSHKRPALRTR